MNGTTLRTRGPHARTARRAGKGRRFGPLTQSLFDFVREGSAGFGDAIRAQRKARPYHRASGCDSEDLAAACGHGHRGREGSPGRGVRPRDRDAGRLTDEQRVLIVEHLDDAYRVAFAREFTHRAFGDHEREERRTLAENGLIKAVMRFDPSLGCSFRTFMYRTIKFAILDANVARKAKKRSFVVFTDLEDENWND